MFQAFGPLKATAPLSSGRLDLLQDLNSIFRNPVNARSRTRCDMGFLPLIVLRIEEHQFASAVETDGVLANRRGRVGGHGLTHVLCLPAWPSYSRSTTARSSGRSQVGDRIL